MNGPDKHHMTVIEMDDGGWHVCNGCKASGALSERPTGICPSPWLDRGQLLALLAARTAWLDRRVAFFTESGIPEDLLAVYEQICAGNINLPEPQAQLLTPVPVSAVAITREKANGMELDWLLKGGISALEQPGTVLLVAQGVVTNYDGRGHVYVLEKTA